MIPALLLGGSEYIEVNFSRFSSRIENVYLVCSNCEGYIKWIFRDFKKYQILIKYSIEVEEALEDSFADSRKLHNFVERILNENPRDLPDFEELENKKRCNIDNTWKNQEWSRIYSLLICFGLKCEESALIVEYYVLLTENLTLAEWWAWFFLEIREIWSNFCFKKAD